MRDPTFDAIFISRPHSTWAKQASGFLTNSHDPAGTQCGAPLLIDVYKRQVAEEAGRAFSEADVHLPPFLDINDSAAIASFVYDYVQKAR